MTFKTFPILARLLPGFTLLYKPHLLLLKGFSAWLCLDAELASKMLFVPENWEWWEQKLDFLKLVEDEDANNNKKEMRED